MKQDLLSFLGQVGVADVAMLLMMNGDVWWRGGALCLLNVGSAGHLALNTPCLLPAGLETSSP
jgi:hypothetical protein